MKKRILALGMAIVMIVGVLPMTTYAASVVNIDETNFPDEIFRTFVAENIDQNADGALTEEECAAVKSINLSVKYISSIKGIEYFTQLEKLNCDDNKLTSLDISKNTKLIELMCDYNSITSLDVSKNTQLTILSVMKNKLTSIDVTMLPQLKYLICEENALIRLDVSKNTELTNLYCEDNELTSLDISNNTKLMYLHCGGNKLTSLDITNCPKLTRSHLSKGTANVINNRPGLSEKFTDVREDHWAYESIDYCFTNGFMNGMSDTTFAPSGALTRAQLVTILYRAAGSPTTQFKATFADVPAGKWYSDAIEWAAANNIVNGIAPGRFNPTGNITREQIATILFRYSGSPAVDDVERLKNYPDYSKLHPYAVNAMSWAINWGLITGIESNGERYLAPQNYATRAQIAEIIMRYDTGAYLVGGLLENLIFIIYR